jgi:membrane associated rhomboid family serine protease
MDDVLARILAQPPWALLIGSVVILSLWAWLFEPARRAMILLPYRVRHHGEVHRLLTAGWVHTDLWHLFVNMLTLYFFASKTMQVLGAARFFVLYLSAVVVSFVPTTLRHRDHPGYATLGASGAVAAVMIAAVLLHPKLQLSLMFVPVPVPGIYFALGYVAYSLWHSYSAGDGINHDAHLSGAVYGAAITYLFEPARVERTVRAFF